MAEDLSKFRSFRNLKRQVNDTVSLVLAIEGQIATTQGVIEHFNLREKRGFGKYKRHLEVSEKQIEKIYELAFVGLFANFECFMFEILKELFYKYPDSFRTEKILKYDEIQDFTSSKQIKDYFIDAVATNKSQDIDIWVKQLEVYGIKFFKDDKHLEAYKLLNAFRNISMHTGGKTSSRFSQVVGGILKTRVPIGQKHSFKMKENFSRMQNLLTILLAQ